MNSNLQMPGEDYIAGFLTDDWSRTKARLVTEKCTDGDILYVYQSIRMGRYAGIKYRIAPALVWRNFVGLCGIHLRGVCVLIRKCTRFPREACTRRRVMDQDVVPILLTDNYHVAHNLYPSVVAGEDICVFSHRRG